MPTFLSVQYISMSIGDVLPDSHRPAAELSLPPQVTGLIEGESLLHISGLRLIEGPQDGQTLQVTAHLDKIPQAYAVEASWPCPVLHYDQRPGHKYRSFFTSIQQGAGSKQEVLPTCRFGCNGGATRERAPCWKSGASQAPQQRASQSAATQSKPSTSP